MNRIIISMLGAALSGAVVAQTVDDSTAFDSGAQETIVAAPDTARYATFGVMESEQPSTAARARSERATTRSSGTASSSAETKSSASRSGKAISRTKDGPTVSVARAMDPEGRKYWARSNRRSTRAAKGCPPGTVQ
ncbi:MAG: hypothetical protein IPI55_15935 [Flavobacteriales bacterium]|nr:hypothetical protein [Flavobacteriales bacterium]